jgi:hypothetical protein
MHAHYLLPPNSAIYLGCILFGNFTCSGMVLGCFAIAVVLCTATACGADLCICMYMCAKPSGLALSLYSEKGGVR